MRSRGVNPCNSPRSPDTWTPRAKPSLSPFECQHPSLTCPGPLVILFTQLEIFDLCRDFSCYFHGAMSQKYLQKQHFKIVTSLCFTQRKFSDLSEIKLLLELWVVWSQTGSALVSSGKSVTAPKYLKFTVCQIFHSSKSAVQSN